MQRRRDAFRDEYNMLLRLSALRQFPQTYGYGQVDGMPAILMEWVEGHSLEEYLVMEGGSRYRPYDVALIGLALFRILDIMSGFGSGFAHRDLSPANIIIRDTKDVQEQVDERELDLCLIDFGSSFIDADFAQTAPSGASTLRGTTPEYAAPEMLTNDIPGVDELRLSPKVDVYAACSVLVELLTGDTPFKLYANPTDIPAWQVKLAFDPHDSVKPSNSEREVLLGLLLLGMAPRQEDRPTPHQMHRAFVRLFRLHDNYKLQADDPQAEFTLAVDPRILIPRESSDDVLPANLQNVVLQAVLDHGEDFGNRSQQVSQKSWLDRLEARATRAFARHTFLGCLLFALAFYALGVWMGVMLA